MTLSRRPLQGDFQNDSRVPVLFLGFFADDFLSGDVGVAAGGVVAVVAEPELTTADGLPLAPVALPASLATPDSTTPASLSTFAGLVLAPLAPLAAELPAVAGGVDGIYHT